MDGSQVPAPVEPGEHDGMEAVGFAIIRASSRDQGGGNHLAVESVLGQDSLQHEAGARGFVGGADRAAGRKAAEEMANLHQIGGKGDHLRLIAGALEDGRSDGEGVHVKTNRVYCIMAGLLSLKSEWTNPTRVALIGNMANQPTTSGRGSSRFYLIKRGLDKCAPVNYIASANSLQAAVNTSVSADTKSGRSARIDAGFSK
jgi:hypothetical protein